jgi:hypothetical protein
MMAITHEVATVDLDQLDGRQSHTATAGDSYADPASTRMALQRAEGRIKIRTASLTATNVGKCYELHAPIDACPHLVLLLALSQIQ